jgi:hypothetical protein
MAEQCRNCGSELFAGQRFCRGCGAPSDPLSAEQAPTQMMPPQPNDWGARGAANTAPANSQHTSPVYAPQSGYQPSAAPMYPQTIPPYTPPQKRSPVGWILAFIGMGLFVAVVVAVMLIARAGRGALKDIGGSRATTAQAGETALADAAEIIPGANETAFIKSFVLDDDATFSLRSLSGSITVSGWDQPKAEVRAIQKGSDRNAPVFFSGGTNNLSIRTAEKGGKDVRYEIKLPRELGQIEIRATNGSIKLSDINARLVVEAGNGSIEMNNVSGVSRAKAGNGGIRSVLQGASDWPMEFIAGNGSIDLTIQSNFDAQLDATAGRGSINIDDRLGIAVEKRVVGAHASGQIGSGGQLLKLTTGNGSINVSKQ